MAQIDDDASGVPPLVAVVGATAVGKSDLAVRLALALNGEVVNADAMQLYRGMDIGTAKLAVPERQGVPHHQLDVLDVRQEASVAAFQRHARDDLTGIATRGRQPVVVGGSGLYVRCLLDRLDIPPTDPAVRAALDHELSRVGALGMHRRLSALDPAAGAAILASNGRRVVRALEVITITGRPFTATLPAQEYLQPTVQLGLQMDRAALDRRLHDRVTRMWSAGLVEEVGGLVRAGLAEGPTASRALGYAQVLAMFEGRYTPEQARQETVAATRRFARRQESWFRRDPRIVWLPATAPDLLDQALAAVTGAARTAGGAR